MPSRLKDYNARWQRAGHPTIGNVSFMARDDAVAIRKADRIAKEIGLLITPRTIHAGTRLVQSLDRGAT